MATFEELMEQFRNPGDTGIPETFAEELTTAYNEDISVRDAAVQERDAKIEAANAAKAAADAEVLRLKAVNYDLIVSKPKTGEPDNKEERDDAEPRGIDSLFS